MSTSPAIIISFAMLFVTAPEFGQSVYSQKQDDSVTGSMKSTRIGMERDMRQEILPAVIALYDAIAPLPTWDQKNVLAGVTPEVKSALWKYNLYVFLDNHPDLTREQRAAVRRDLNYVSDPHVFANHTDPSDLRLSELLTDGVAATIDAAGFSPEMATTAFIHLGPVAIRNHSELLNELSAAQFQPTPTTYPDCMCKSNVGCWEYYATFCDWGYICVPRYTCGYNGTQACYGVCSLQ